MAKTYTWRTWKARPRTIDGKKFKMVFQGCIKDFKKAEMDARAENLRKRGYLVRLGKKKTLRGMEWVIWAH